MKTALFVCYPKALLTSMSLPMEMIAAATAISRLRRLNIKPWQCQLVASTAERSQLIEFAKGIHVQPSFDLTNAPDAEMIFLPPMWGNPDVVVDNSPELKAWIIQQYQRGAQIIATGTGVCLLADAGLLDEKVATTHWYYFDQFEKKYPRVKLQRHHFITQAGELFCCGSINSLVDLTLYFIKSYFDQSVSQIIERHFGHEINRTYDKPWYSSGASRHPDEGILEVQRWMQSHYSKDFNLKSLAQMANMSVRNFSRRFKSAVGESALAYGVNLKMQMARELLKETNLPHQDIADQLGFKDSAYFSRQFKAKNEMTPGEYRQMVRGKLFNL